MKSIFRKLRGGEAGIGLVEALVALVIIGFVAVALLSGLATGAKAGMVADEQATAESLARSQIEYIKGLEYQTVPATYSVDPSLTLTGGWSIPDPVAEAVPTLDSNIQKVTVIIQRYGRTVLTVATYKANR